MTPQAAQLGSAAVAGGSGLIGSVINYFSQRQTNKANLDLAKQQNDWNIEQWNRENAYNSPQNQVQLLRDAGINPAVYSNNGATSGQVSSADFANQQAPQIDLQGPAQTGLTALQTTAQMEALRAEIAESKLRQDQARQAFPGQLQAIGLANLLTAAQTRNVDQATKNAWQQAFIDIQNMPWDIHTKRQILENLKLQPGVVAQDIKESDNRIKVANEQLAQAWKDIELKAHLQKWQIKQLQADIRSVNANTDLLAFRVRMAKKYNIDPNLPALNNLITLSLSDPAQFNNVASSLLDNIKQIPGIGLNVGETFFGLNPFGFGFRNPHHFRHGGSW